MCLFHAILICYVSFVCLFMSMYLFVCLGVGVADWPNNHVATHLVSYARPGTASATKTTWATRRTNKLRRI